MLKVYFCVFEVVSGNKKIFRYIITLHRSYTLCHCGVTKSGTISILAVTLSNFDQLLMKLGNAVSGRTPNPPRPMYIRSGFSQHVLFVANVHVTKQSAVDVSIHYERQSSLSLHAPRNAIPV